jgi:hypothetical protein
MGRSLLACVATLAVSALPMFGSTISVDGTYHEFAFGLAPDIATGCAGHSCTPSTNPVAEQSSDSPWTFSGQAILFLIDVGHKGDRFEAFDNSISLGLTTDVGNPPNVDDCGFNIGCAVANLGYSRGTYLLPAGSHSITIDLVQNAGTTEFGQAFFSVSPAESVPEPETAGLFTVGLLAFTVSRFRRQKVA